MGGGASKDTDLAVFTELEKEFEAVADEDEETQFNHMRKKFKEKKIVWSNDNPQQNQPRKHRGIHAHMHVKFKTAAKMIGKLEAAKKHFNKGLRTTDLDFHHGAANYNMPHPELGHDALITNALSETIFSKTEKKALKAAIRDAEEKVLDAGTVIIHEGETGHTYYIVESGVLDIIQGGAKTGTYEAGQHFGELSLVYMDHSEATIQVSNDGPAKVWMMKREVFKKIQQQTHGGMLFKRAQWLRRVESFKVLSDQQIMRICHALEEEQVKPAVVIAEQGTHGDAMYIVVSGNVEEYVSGRRHSSVEDHSKDHIVTTLGPGDFFGEHALINRPHHYNATYKSSDKSGEEGVELLKMTQEIMDLVLGPLKQVLEEADILNSLLSSETELCQIPNARLLLAPLVHKMEKQEIPKDTVIVAKDGIAQGIYVLKTGVVHGYEKEGVESFTDGDTFGEECLAAHPEFGHNPPNDIIATETSVLYCLKKEVIEEFLVSHKKRTDGTAAHCVDRSSIVYGDWEDLGLLGEGSFGTVTMVKCTLPDGGVECLALKRMGKNHLVEEDMLESTQQEKDILGSLTPHPFVIRLYATYQDRDSVYMLTNLMQGGELYDFLHQDGRDKELSTNDARFYTANIFLALSHLHEHGFVYRDMKPENVLIGRDGYLCLIDLGFAKACPYHIQTEGQDVYHEQCFTTCGTPEYMAPEFIFQTGHDKGADYWAMGCLIFEMFHGFTPFVDRSQPDDLSQIFVNIALHNNNNYTIPWKKGFSGSDEALFIEDILHPKSVYRLGVLNKGRHTFMHHTFFHGFNWEKLENKGIEPPMKPAVMDQFDKSNFGNKISQLEPDPFDKEIYEEDPFKDW